MICRMTLTPLRRDGRPANLPPASIPIEEAPAFPAPGKVYTQYAYSLQLSDWSGEPPALKDLERAQVYVNDEVQPVSVSAGGEQASQADGPVFQMRFTAPSGGLLFRDCFGYVDVTIFLESGGRFLCLRSGALEVVVANDPALTASMEEMAAYVYAHQEDFLFSGEARSRVRWGLKKDGRPDLFAQIALAQECAQVFEDSYPYFKANCRFQIRKVPTVQPLERLQYIAPSTLQYAVGHPEELRPAAGRTGIRVGRRDYQPRRAMGLVNRAAMETPENQALLGFLKTLLEDVRRLRRGSSRLRDAAGRREEDGAWISSPCILLAPLRQDLEDAMAPLRQLENRLARLLRMYSRILPIAAPRLHRPPKPTAVFRSVPEYNRIFTCCRRWFQFGLYDPGESRLRALLPFLRTPDLYEVYCLARLFACLREEGWTGVRRERRAYPPPQGWYSGWTWPPAPAFGNVFTFQKGGDALTVFYQPVAYSGQDRAAGSNGMGLCRTTSIIFRKDPEEDAAGEGRYYHPDFVLKLRQGGETRYIVADAKFSRLENVRRYEVPALAFKYLFSLRPKDPGETLAGLCLFCGQCGKKEAALRDLHDCFPAEEARTPFAAVLTFPGGADSRPLREFLSLAETLRFP